MSFGIDAGEEADKPGGESGDDFHGACWMNERVLVKEKTMYRSGKRQFSMVW